MAKTTAGERAFKAQPAEIAKRSSRNKARAIVTEKLGAAAVKGMEVDHKDDNPLNNKPSNLRLVTPRANNNGKRGGAATMKGKR